MFNAFKEKIVPEIKSLRQKATEAENKLKRVEGGQYAESFYTHPEAYTLTPEYQRASTEVGIANFEEQQHRAALSDLRSKKEKVRVFTGYDQQGNAVYAEVNGSDDATREQAISDLTASLSAIAAHRAQWRNTAQQIAMRHQQRNGQIDNMIRELETKKLGRYAAKDNPRAKEIETFFKSLPPELRGERLASPLAKMYGYLIDMSIQVKTLKQQLAAKAAAKNDERRAEPTSGKKSKSTSRQSVSDLTFKWDDNLNSDIELS